ncbi:MAG TPA: hypothetical protein VFV00_07215 [Acidimicrobiales bacterium]|nr:hypothetical protein [Acidimicrobiales bacterium]
MNESGINSFEEFLLFYIATGFVIGCVWAVLEAHVLLGPADAAADRRARQRALSRVFAIGGIAHAAFALVAVDLTRASDVEPATDERARRRAQTEARLGLVVGCAVILLLSLPHIPVLGAFPGVSAIEGLAPWE